MYGVRSCDGRWIHMELMVKKKNSLGQFRHMLKMETCKALMEQTIRQLCKKCSNFYLFWSSIFLFQENTKIMKHCDKK